MLNSKLEQEKSNFSNLRVTHELNFKVVLFPGEFTSDRVFGMHQTRHGAGRAGDARRKRVRAARSARKRLLS